MSKMSGPEGAAHCPHCGEPLLVGDDIVRFGEPLYHHECALRMVVGGVNHQNGTCWCCGGDQPPDPPGLSYREAARATADCFRARLPQDEVPL